MPFETVALPDVAPDSRDAPPFWEPEPTQMLDAAELQHEPPPPTAPKQPFTRSVFPEGTELLPRPEESVAATGAPPGETGELSGLDALFGESQFREYDSRPDPSESPFARREPLPRPPAGGGVPPGGDAPVAADAPRPGVSRLQKVLLAVLGSLLAALLLVVLFFLGTRLPELLGPAPAVTVPSASPSPSASAVIAVGPVAPGDYRYDELLGGECLDPFESPWQDRFTVVDCEVPHAAQLVRIGEYPIPDTGPDPYPGEDDLQARALAYCQRSGIYSTAVGKLKDAVIGVSYPVSAESWVAGDRHYSCFVWRSSGEPITADIALPQPTPTPTPAP
jgi:hypothetical protein